MFNAVAGAETGVLGVRMRVIEAPANLTLRVEPIGAQDITAANGNRFSRIREVPPVTAPPSRRIGEFELTWTPPLSLFKIAHGLPGGCKFELVLNPQTSTSYQRRAIESVLGRGSLEPLLQGGTPDATKFSLNVVNMYLYTCTVEGPRADNITFLLDLEQTRCQSEKVQTRDFQQVNFDVSPSTKSLCVAFQDLRAGENTSISASKFKSYDAAPIPTTSQELKLDRFFINYAGQNLPSPDSDPTFVAGTDYTTQRYTESQLYSGGYWDTGGVESIEEYHARGAYYLFQFPRDATDKSTRVNVHSKFSAGTDVSNTRLLCFDISKQVCRVQISQGRVTSIELEDS